MRQFWSARDIALLRGMYPHIRTELVAAALGRTLTATYGAAKKLGVSKSAAFLASAESGVLRKGETRAAMVPHQFTPGHVPANKGLRRPGWAPGRMSETQFKRGERKGIAARNWKPIGTILPDSEGYFRIKVREAAHGEPTGFGNMRVWPLLGRHVWEQHNGPIPENHTVCFKNGDRSNCDISNLELISRADLARRNTMWGRYPRELALAIQLNSALKRKLRNIANGKE